MGKRILISLGGNALGTLYNELLESVNIIAKPIAKLVEDGNEVVICHGNGPQVGYIKKNIDVGAMESETESLPLSECVAMSQSFIGYQLSNAIENELKNKFFSETNSYEILYDQMSYAISSLYKLQPVISEFIIDFEED